jgi:hypothetical protein
MCFSRLFEFQTVIKHRFLADAKLWVNIRNEVKEMTQVERDEMI